MTEVSFTTASNEVTHGFSLQERNAAAQIGLRLTLFTERQPSGDPAFFSGLGVYGDTVMVVLDLAGAGVAVRPARVFETVLYAEDLAAGERFYQEALGLDHWDVVRLMVTLPYGDGVLLTFGPRKSGVSSRDVPSHGTTGAGHVAFPAKPEDLPAWRDQLRRAGVSVEREVDGDEAGHSIYFRDPAGG